MYAGMQVVDPAVAHPSNDFFAQRILVKNCDASKWFEVGMTEVGWLPSYQLQYPYISTSQDGWGFFVQEELRPRPGDRVYFMLLPRGTGDGWWQAFMNSDRTQGWLLMSEFNLGSNNACGNEAYVQIDASSTSNDFAFGATEWGNFGGGSNGVMLRDPASNSFNSWDLTIATQESNSSGRYGVTWLSRYYHSQVASEPSDTSVDGGLESGEDLLATTPAYPYLGEISTAVIQAREDLLIPDQLDDLVDEQMDDVVDRADEILLDELEGTTRSWVGQASGPIRTAYEIYRSNGGSGGGNGITAGEVVICAANPFDCARTATARSDALEWSEKYFPGARVTNSIRDAHRHCVWSALMTNRANDDFAKQIGDAHEEGANDRASKMDRWNNGKGRLVGFDTEDQSDRWLANKCREWAYGDILIIKKSDSRIDSYSG
jgi:hypothetical protein